MFEKVKNQELVRRDLTLVDSSGVFVSLSLFGPQALQLSQVALTNTPLAAIKGKNVGVKQSVVHAFVFPMPISKLHR